MITRDRSEATPAQRSLIAVLRRGLGLPEVRCPAEREAASRELHRLLAEAAAA